MGIVAAVGLAIRLAYVVGGRPSVAGDGIDYHLDALRLVDGLGYTGSLFYPGAADAQHPPAWVTLLAGVSWLGPRSQLTHQLVGVAVGMALIVVVALVARRYFDDRVALVAAALAAVYPGFWLLEAGILAEPLALLVLGGCFLLVARLRDAPSALLAIAAGATCGLAALVRSEQALLLVLVVVPVLATRHAISVRHRLGLIALAGCTTALVIAPWTIYNLGRFEEPVLLSVNGWSTVLSGNCPTQTYEGPLLGHAGFRCTVQVTMLQGQDLDPSQMEVLYRDAAVENIRENLDRLPVVVPARVGRAVGLYEPSQTVDLQAQFLGARTELVWAWVASYLLMAPFAVLGAWRALRSGRFVLILLVPTAVAFGMIALVLGEPRWHSPGDLGVVVLAAYGMVGLAGRLGGGHLPANARLQSREEI